jgi:hypothetical protein
MPPLPGPTLALKQPAAATFTNVGHFVIAYSNFDGPVILEDSENVQLIDNTYIGQHGIVSKNSATRQVGNTHRPKSSP